jgi:hypothetical protein
MVVSSGPQSIHLATEFPEALRIPFCNVPSLPVSPNNPMVCRYIERL